MMFRTIVMIIMNKEKVLETGQNEVKECRILIMV